MEHEFLSECHYIPVHDTGTQKRSAPDQSEEADKVVTVQGRVHL